MLKPRFDALCAKTHELMGFLVDMMQFDAIDASYAGRVTYHDSCSSLREHGVKAQPRRLLANHNGLRLDELEGTEVCCGFGATFCVEYPLRQVPGSFRAYGRRQGCRDRGFRRRNAAGR